ncbi:MAG: pseudouridine synthase [Gemmatimonadota bacterium]
MAEPLRLQQYLARAGAASRRASEELIAAGRVRVDGVTVTQTGTRVDPERSVVEVDGRRVRLRPTVWVLLHKPPGYLCTRGDPEGRPTVYELLPPELGHLFHVGRLDYLSEGLLLLTNDGDAADRLMHPRGRTIRRYEVTLAEPLPEGLVERLLTGVRLEDGMARAAAARLEAGSRQGEWVLRLTLREGRNREIRRMMEALRVKIRALKRVALGPVLLGDLPRGEWRKLSAPEVRRLTAQRVSGRPAGRSRRRAPPRGGTRRSPPRRQDG